MLTEACATLKPVYMFDLHTGPENCWWLLESLIGKVDTSWWRRIRRLRLQPLVFRIAFVIGPTRMTRDVRIIHRQLQAQGRAGLAGGAVPERAAAAPLDDVPRAVARVKALFEESVGAHYRAACAAPDPGAPASTRRPKRLPSEPSGLTRTNHAPRSEMLGQPRQ